MARLDLEAFWRDTRHGFRVLRRSPFHSTAIVALLALAIGANVAIFSLVNALLLRELPVERPDELVAVKRMSRGASQGMSIPLFETLRPRVTTMDLMAIADSNVPLVVDPSDPATVTDAAGAMVSGNYFRVLQARAALGRLIGVDDDRFADPQPVIVLGHKLWSRSFGGDGTVVGRSVLLGGHRFTVVGVAAEELRALGGDRGLGGDYWIPLNMQPVVSGGTDRRRNPGASMLRVMGRRQSASLQYAQAEIDVLSRQLPAEMIRPDSAIQLFPGHRGFGDALATQYWPPLRVMMVGVALLLVMACANIASLLLARSSARQQEIAVRQALGSGRAVLVRQLSIESLMLAAAGGALGLAWAGAGARVLVALAVPAAPELDLSIDGRVLLFTGGIALAATLVFGLAPALQLTPRRIESALRLGTRGATARSRHVFNKALVASQAALAVILVVGALQFAGSLYRLYAVDLGFDRRNMVIAAVDGRPAGYQTEAQFSTLATQIIDRLSALPAVESVTVAATGFLGGGRRSTRNYAVDDRQYGGAGDPPLYFNEVSSGYLHAFRVPFVAGRDFDARDRPGAPPVAIVNEAFVRRYLPDRPPIGRRLAIDAARGDIEIVGVVGNSTLNDLRAEVEPLVFLPLGQFPARFNHVLIRARHSGDDVLSAVRPAILGVDHRLRVDRVQTLDSALDETLAEDILAARLSGAFGVAAIMLVCFGVYGVVSYLVVTRTREIGVRLAIGALPGTVRRQVVRDALWTALPGLAIGTAIAAALERVIASQLFASQAGDPFTFGAAWGVLGIVTVLAAYVPARRAAAIAPVIALRD